MSNNANIQNDDALNDEDRKLISSLYEKNYAFLIYYAAKECKNRVAAEDIVQDTFYFAMKDNRIKKIRNHMNPIGWLMKVLQFKIQAFRRRRSNWEMPDIAEFEEVLSSSEEQFGMLELGMVLDKVFTPHEWMLFYMYYVEGRTAKEMAQCEGITESNFKVRMLRLRKKVAKELGRE